MPYSISELRGFQKKPIGSTGAKWGRQLFSPVDFLETVRGFLERGGTVLSMIAWVIFIMWTLIVDRALYLRREHPRAASAALAKWRTRGDTDSWHAEQIYHAIVSRLSMRLEVGIPVIKTLAAVCPLLGLLGTVTGMILIFDVMAYLGSTSPRAVAAGVSTATITTMGGMVGALSGIFPAAWLARKARQHKESLASGEALAVADGHRPPSPAERGLHMLLAPLAAAVVTVGLLFLMEQLILTGEEALTRSSRNYLVDFVRIEREETLARKERKPERIATPAEEAPDHATRYASRTPAAGGRRARRSGRPSSPGIEVQGCDRGRQWLSVSPILSLMPIYKIAPVYPRTAAQRGLEGWVMVRFTVTAIGAVRDVEVVESSHKVFERSAMAAAAKFKFRPRLINGEPVEVTNVYNRIVFELEEKPDPLSHCAGPAGPASAVLLPSAAPAGPARRQARAARASPSA